MENHCQNIQELMPEFITGTLPAEKADALQEHIDTCPVCAEYLRALQGDDKLLGDFAEAMQPTVAQLEDGVIDALNRMPSQKPVSSVSIWRIIIKSRITKFAAAVAIITAVILSITVLDKSVPTAFGIDDVWAAMGKAKWVHTTWEYVELNLEAGHEGEVVVESWMSVNPQRNVRVYKNGHIHFAEQLTDEIKTQHTQHYDPQTNILTTIYRCTSENNNSHASIEDMYLEQLSAMEKIGTKVEYADIIYDGSPANMINIDYTSKSGEHRKYSIVADVETHLPKRMTFHCESSVQSGTANVTFDYPESGPTDIYEAGAPRDATVKVVDHRPSSEFLEAIKPYRQARENLPAQRIVVDIEYEIDNRYRVCVIYTDGRKERFEQLMWIRDDVPPATDDFGEILDWALSAKSLEFGVQLYDGECVYHVERDYRDRWTTWEEYSPSRKPSYVVGGLIHRGWPRIRKGRPVENNYATENNLLCIETRRRPNVKDNKLLKPAEKTLYYIDPEHDYICVRIESFKHTVAADSYAEIDELHFDPNETLSEPYWVTEVTKFGRNEGGQWYPSEIITNRLSWWEDYDSEDGFVIRLYVETCPKFPEDVFEPVSLPDVNE